MAFTHDLRGNTTYDGTALIGEYDGSGNLLRRYVHGLGVDRPLVWHAGPGDPACAIAMAHASSLQSQFTVMRTSLGKGVPAPVSTIAFRLIRNIAHLVPQ